MAENRTLILGLGNEILTDDAIGPKLAYRLEKEPALKNCDFLTAAVGGLEVVEMIIGYEKVILIDAIRTGKAEPGTVFFLTPDNFRETLHLSSFHDVSFLTGLKMASRLGQELPCRIHIVAIEIVEDLVFSDQFSPEIESIYDSIYREVRGGVVELLGSE